MPLGIAWVVLVWREGWCPSAVFFPSLNVDIHGVRGVFSTNTHSTLLGFTMSKNGTPGKKTINPWVHADVGPYLKMLLLEAGRVDGQPMITSALRAAIVNYVTKVERAHKIDIRKIVKDKYNLTI